MSKPKYMDDYNYHDWSQFMVRSPKQRPIGAHFAAVLFETRNEWTPPYDRYDEPTGSSSTIEYVSYFAFPDKQTLSEWVSRAAKNKMQFFCFEVKKIGSVEVKVNVDIEV